MLKRIREEVYSTNPIFYEKKDHKRHREFTLSLRGIQFTNIVLSIILDDMQINLKILQNSKFGPEMIRWICLQKQISRWDKINMCVDILYNKNNRRSIKAIWIAPTQRDNAKVGLNDGVELNDQNCIGDNNLYRKHHFLWGFNAGSVSKWNTLKKGDLIIFGNSRDNFMILGEVEYKFIWLRFMSEKIFDYSSPSGKAWRYGFTLRILHRNLNITSKEQSELSGGIIFQTQTRVTNPVPWFTKLETILGYSLY